MTKGISGKPENYTNQENLKTSLNYRPIFILALAKISFQNFSRSALFYKESRVFLKYLSMIFCGNSFLFVKFAPIPFRLNLFETFSKVLV